MSSMSKKISNSEEEKDIATGFGAAHYSPSSFTSFSASSSPYKVLYIKYEWERNFCNNMRYKHLQRCKTFDDDCTDCGTYAPYPKNTIRFE